MNFRSKNPVLNGIESSYESSRSYVTGETATFSGIAIKTAILLTIIFGISAYIWFNFENLIGVLPVLLVVSTIGGLFCVLLASFVRSAVQVFTILYAIFEGIFLGSISYVLQFTYPGIATNAITITFSIFLFLLIAYATGLFKVGFKFRKIVYTMMFSVLIFMVFNLVLSLFGLNIFASMPFEFLLLFTVAMVILASFNLLIDFDNCKYAVNEGLPKNYEWNLSLGLLVSLVWLYIEVIRLLIIITDRRK